MRHSPGKVATQVTALLCIALIVPGDPALFAQGYPPPQPPPPTNGPAPMNPTELESLLAPIALYPDQLLAQILAASTYPLQVVDASRWLNKNQSLQGQALVKAAAQQQWDPSIQALVLFPSVLQRMDDNLKWTTALGNAFLAQQEDVMLAVQRLRQKAQAAGTLKTNAQQKVELQQVEGARVIVIQPASPDVVYVPAYNPAVIWGAAPVYAPYPPMYYPPPSTGAIVAATAISFGAGIALGSWLGGWHGGGWGWGVNWGPRPALYVNNTFVNRFGFRAPPGARPYGNAAWAHNPASRGAVPYSNPAVANRYGAAGVRGPNGAAGAVRTPYGGAVGVRTPNSAAGAVGGASRTAAGVQTPRGSAGAVSTPRGSAARLSTPQGSVVKTPQGTFTNAKPSPFSGSAAQTRMNSQRGAGSMGNRGAGGGGRRR
jgi:Protein of unknown function (DUF3300)